MSLANLQTDEPAIRLPEPRFHWSEIGKSKPNGRDKRYLLSGGPGCPGHWVWGKSYEAALLEAEKVHAEFDDLPESSKSPP